MQRAAQRAARKNTSGTNTPVPVTPPEVSPANHPANTVTPESRPKSADAPNPHPTATPDRKPAHSSPNAANPNRIPARLNRRSEADELHKLEIALDGAARGNLDDFQTVLEAAGWYDPEGSTRGN